MLGLTELHRRRDRHFGNGRAVRNLFEHAIRRMANRIADIAELSQEQLMLLDAADIEFSGPACRFLARRRRQKKCVSKYLAPLAATSAKRPASSSAKTSAAANASMTFWPSGARWCR